LSLMASNVHTRAAFKLEESPEQVSKLALTIGRY
jgi:hypothetical protein